VRNLCSAPARRLTLFPVVQARDAMLQADADIFAGEFRCIISNAFASRGLGALADGENFVNDFTPAEGC